MNTAASISMPSKGQGALVSRQHARAPLTLEGIEQLPPTAHKWIEVADSGCWLWTGKDSGHGYCHISFTLDGARRHVLVHRLFYKVFVGPLTPGLEVDHLCFHRNCCYPPHLELVTHTENTRRLHERAHDEGRKSTCKHGVTPMSKCKECVEDRINIWLHSRAVEDINWALSVINDIEAEKI